MTGFSSTVSYLLKCNLMVENKVLLSTLQLDCSYSSVLNKQREMKSI